MTNLGHRNSSLSTILRNVLCLRQNRCMKIHHVFPTGNSPSEMLKLSMTHTITCYANVEMILLIRLPTYAQITIHNCLFFAPKIRKKAQIMMEYGGMFFHIIFEDVFERAYGKGRMNHDLVVTCVV